MNKTFLFYDIFPIENEFDIDKGLTKAPEIKYKTYFNFNPSSNSKVVVRGQILNKESRWIDKSAKGTYVYWGQAKPLINEKIITVVDSTVPSWVVKDVENISKK